jgi:transitional endoplasmic reticulum ATPase
MSDPNPVLNALKQALEQAPNNGPLWLHYGDLLGQAGRVDEAVTALQTAAEFPAEKPAAIRKVVALLREAGRLAEAVVRAERHLQTADDPALRLEYARVLEARGDVRGAYQQYLQARAADANIDDFTLEALREAATDESDAERAPLGLDAWQPEEPPEDAPVEEEERERALAEVNPEPADMSEWAGKLDWGDLYLTFNDVAGLEEVKNQIRLRIIAPFKNPEIYRAFRRTGGGGLLLYGPPGCGKTFIARATAGECGARFMAVGIHEMIDKYWGESEKLMHAVFEEARRRAPTVLFFDEFDALGSSRGRTESQFFKTIVDQLLQEMDGMSGRNDDVLIFAATNVPWNVDPAFRRPGRFDRVIFVPPPDEPARVEILRRHSERLPGGETIDVAALARQTPLMTGADLKSLCERASERSLARSLDTGTIHPVTMEEFERELKQMQTSASEWMATARNYARYSNEGGQYDELTDFLKKNKRW